MSSPHLLQFHFTRRETPEHALHPPRPVDLPRVGFYLKSADASWTMSWKHSPPTWLPLSFGIGEVIPNGAYGLSGAQRFAGNRPRAALER